MSTGAIIAIVAARITVLLLGLGVLASVAIPLFFSQRDKAMDAAAQADVIGVATEVYYAWVDFPETGPSIVAEYAVEHTALPEVTIEGGEYVVSGPDGEYGRAPVSPGVEFAGYGTDGTYFCLGLHAAEGDVKDVHYSADEALADGPCP